MTVGRFSWVLTVIRVLMGAFFLMEGVQQLASGYIGGSQLAEKFQKALDKDSALPGYDYLLEHVFLKIDDPLTVLVIIGELAVGTALVLGLLTRFTAVMALFMNVNFFLMNGFNADSGGIDAVFIVGEIALFAFASRQALSADEALARRGVSGVLMSGAVGQSRA